MGRSVFDGVSDGSWAVFAEKAVAARDAAIEAAVKAKAEMQSELDLARSLHDVAVRQRDAANFLVEEVTKERDEARAEVERLLLERNAAFDDNARLRSALRSCADIGDARVAKVVRDALTQDFEKPADSVVTAGDLIGLRRT